MTDSENVTTDPAESTDTAQATGTDETTAAEAGTETATEETTMTDTTTTSASSQATTATADVELVDIETLAKDLPGWELAGVMRHNRWAKGKALTKSDFEAAVAAFEGRKLGGGR